jgi:hypothetical protein
MPVPVKNIFTYTTPNLAGVNLDITSIPQDGKHLLCYFTSTASNGTANIRYNNFTSNYMYNSRNIDGNNNNANMSAASTLISQWAWSVSDRHGTFFFIPFYAENGTRKPLISHNGMLYFWTVNSSTYYYCYAACNTNTNTSPVTSLQFLNMPNDMSITVDLVY